jgi:pimeloyl-ACP methyl ester carboxylesterase
MDRQAAFARTIRHVPFVRAITYDRRGYAKSSGVTGPFTIESNVSDLFEIIDRVGGKVHAVGHSFGGVTVLAAAEKRPEVFWSVAVYESPMSWEPWWPASTGGAAAVARRDDPESAAEMFLKRFIGEERWSRLPESTKAKRRAEGRALVEELSDLRRRPAYLVDRITIPVISAVGTRAGEHVKAAAKLLAEKCSPVPLVEIEGAWHNAPASSPEQFAELVVRPLVKLGP